MSGRQKYLRWAAVVPAAVLSWYGAFLVGFFAASSLDYFCPVDLVISGLCTAWWYKYAVDTMIVTFAGIAAFLIVISTTAVAPSHKMQVAWTAFACGLAFAIYSVWYTKAFGAFSAAVISGLFAIFCIARLLRVSMLPKQATNSDAAGSLPR